MPRLSIVLEGHELAALADIGLREHRTPRDQAGQIIADYLRRRGVLPEPDHAAGREPATAVPA